MVAERPLCLLRPCRQDINHFSEYSVYVSCLLQSGTTKIICVGLLIAAALYRASIHVCSARGNSLAFVCCCLEFCVLDPILLMFPILVESLSNEI